nr:hypothetical protein [Candidatus Arsenophonus triatominarum]
MILVEKNSFFFNLLSLRIFLLFYLIDFKIFFDKSAIFIFSQLSLIPNSGYKTFLQVSSVRYSGLALSEVSPSPLSHDTVSDG